MSSVGFVLISTDIGKEGEVIKKLERVKGISELYMIRGKFDIIAKIKANDPERIGQITRNEIQTIPSVRIAQTLVGPSL